MAMVAQGATILISKPAGADLSALQFYFVKLSAGTYVAVTAATDKPEGVLQNKPTLGQPAEIIMFGPSKVNADAAIVAGALIGPSADGQADTKIPGTDTTEYACGHADEAAAAAGDIISAFIDCVSPGRAA